MNPQKKTIRDVADIMAYNGFGRQAVKVQTPHGNPVLSPDALAAAKTNYYNDVPNMSLATLRRERKPDIIPQMTVEQLRTLSNELYLTMNPNELGNRYNHFLSNNPNFPQEINNPDGGTEYNHLLGRGFAIFWERGGMENTPTNLFDHALQLNMDEHYDQWRQDNERRYFETIYRALITPIPNGGGKRTRRTKRRKTRKSRKNKRKTKRRRA
jgi:hypothetical protein